jgi:hypothetical protein
MFRRAQPAREDAMPDLLQQELAGPPVTVVIGGNSYVLTYGMAAVIVYKTETARIERSRPQPVVKDPKCICGEPQSRHTGPSQIILGEDEELLCWAFRLYDPLQGDSLLTRESWSRIDLDLDPERWLACLWAGLHRLVRDGSNEKWEAPMSLASLGSMIPVGPDARQLSIAMVKALRYAAVQPRKDDADPNVEAPAADLTKDVPAQSSASGASPTSTGSTPEPGAASESAAPSS